jgi:fatty acid desaturase
MPRSISPRLTYSGYAISRSSSRSPVRFENVIVIVCCHADLLAFSDGLPLWNQWQPTRSGYYPLFVSEVLARNFNFRIEHHLFPALPSSSFASADVIRPALSDDSKEANRHPLVHRKPSARHGTRARRNKRESRRRHRST